MVNRTRINSTQSIFFGISPVVKQYHPLPSSITCKGVVSWFSEWYGFLSNVSQPIRYNYFTRKYNITKMWCKLYIKSLLLHIKISHPYDIEKSVLHHFRTVYNYFWHMTSGYNYFFFVESHIKNRNKLNFISYNQPKHPGCKRLYLRL